MESHEFNNSEYYSVSQILQTANRKIIIPDFQRDYCWGDAIHGGKKNQEIVSGFLDTLIEEFKLLNDSFDEILLGKIDVYHNPKNQIYLTDGQQRLTTLYLLIGILYRKADEDQIKCRLRQCLISKEEENGDKEPYLQYGIRDSSIFFLKDLVNQFFLSNDKAKIKELRKQSWYCNDFNLDPTIKSIINALEKIEQKLEESVHLNLNKFSLFIINQVKIQYYDVVDREHGEERFVIINTTGKSLTEPENIKPILLGRVENKTYALQWEERETWFWKYARLTRETTADEPVREFMTWYFQIKERQVSINLIKSAKKLFKEGEAVIIDNLAALNSYFNGLKLLLQLISSNNLIQQQLKFINEHKEIKNIIDLRTFSKEQKRLQNILLPLLLFINKVSSNERDVYRFVRRLRKNYFDLIWKDRNENYVDWRYVLQIIERCNSVNDCIEFENQLTLIPNVKLATWFNDEQKLKSVLNERHKDKLERLEDHVDFMGDLSFLFSIYGFSSTNTQHLSITDELFDKVELSYNNYCSTIDLVRSNEIAKSDPILANYFRLFRLFIGCNHVGHIYKASWEFEGVLFSTLNRDHLQKEEFKLLCKCPTDLKTFCIDFLKTWIRKTDLLNVNEDNFTVNRFINVWLTLKTFYSSMDGELLSFYDGKNDTGIAAYIERDRNRLLKSLPFSLENSICGFGVKSGFGQGNRVEYTSKEFWSDSNVINAPFGRVEHKESLRDSNSIHYNKIVIDNIIQFINNN